LLAAGLDDNLVLRLQLAQLGEWRAPPAVVPEDQTVADATRYGGTDPVAWSAPQLGWAISFDNDQVEIDLGDLQDAQ
jgi:hypothetical protein